MVDGVLHSERLQVVLIESCCWLFVHVSFQVLGYVSGLGNYC